MPNDQYMAGVYTPHRLKRYTYRFTCRMAGTLLREETHFITVEAMDSAVAHGLAVKEALARGLDYYRCSCVGCDKL